MTQDHPHHEDPSSVGPPATPGWVKGLLIGLAVLIALVVAGMLISGGQHGPGMHG